MCVIAIKPKGTEMPSDETIGNMWDNNPDGAGFMYAHGGKVHIEKGYMKLKHFCKRLSKLGKEINVFNTTVILHFRIGTHGSKNAANTHPFPISDSLGVLTRLKCECDIGVVHNGIIPIKIRNKDISDTMEYVMSQLSLWREVDAEFYRSEAALKLIAQQTGSKFAFLAPDGDYSTIGTFIPDANVLYSNVSFEPWEVLLDACDWQRVPNKSTYSKTTLGKKAVTYDKVSLVWLEPEAECITLSDGEMIEVNWHLMNEWGDVYEYDEWADTVVILPGARVVPTSANYTQYDDADADLFDLGEAQRGSWDIAR